jgi:hypothetical protein
MIHVIQCVPRAPSFDVDENTGPATEPPRFGLDAILSLFLYSK